MPFRINISTSDELAVRLRPDLPAKLPRDIERRASGPTGVGRCEPTRQYALCEKDELKLPSWTHPITWLRCRVEGSGRRSNFAAQRLRVAHSRHPVSSSINCL